MYMQERISPSNNSLIQCFQTLWNITTSLKMDWFSPRLFNMLQVFALLLLRSVWYIFLTQVSLSYSSSPSLWQWFQPGCTSESPGDLSQNLDAQTPSPEVQIQLLWIGPRVSVALKTPRLFRATWSRTSVSFLWWRSKWSQYTMEPPIWQPPVPKE